MGVSSVTGTLVVAMMSSEADQRGQVRWLDRKRQLQARYHKGQRGVYCSCNGVVIEEELMEMRREM
jgi:hypothetical protein